jgi:transposase
MGIERIPKGKFTREFRAEAVRMVVEDKLSVAEVSRRLQLPEQTIRNWGKAYKEGKLGEMGKGQKEMSSLERELYETKRELARVKMERDILKKATAYFARESLPGTR